MPGAYSIKKLIPQAYLIWIVPPSLEILRKRIMRRKGVKTEEVEQRLVIAQQEISTEVHAKFFDYHLINDELEVAIENLKQLMISVMLR